MDYLELKNQLSHSGIIVNGNIVGASEEYLAHYRTKGSKNGVRNALWYPIDAFKAFLARGGKKAAAEKKELTEQNANETTSNNSTDKVQKVESVNNNKNNKESKPKVGDRELDERELERKKHLAENHDLKAIAANKDLFSEAELKEVLERKKAEDAIDDYLKERAAKEAGPTKQEMALKYIDNATNVMNSVGNFASGVEKVYKGAVFVNSLVNAASGKAAWPPPPNNSDGGGKKKNK